MNFVTKIFDLLNREILHRTILIVCLLSILALSPHQSHAADPRLTIQQASEMIDNGNASGAYQLLEKYEDSYAGWWEYDYVLGVAALESGQANLAILALQRSLAMNPRLAGAHVDLGRAYYEVREYYSAKQEFETALSHKPNATTTKIAKTYLRLLTPQRFSKPKQYTVNFFISSSAGYDTNANSATNAKTFEGFELSAENIQTPSLYASGMVGVQSIFKLTAKNIAVFAANYSQRYNKDATMVNFNSYNALGLWRYNSETVERKVGIQLQRTDVEDNISSYVTAFTFSQSLALYKALHFDLLSNLSSIDYGTELSERNALQFVAGGGFSLKPKSLLPPSLHFSAFAGKYHPKESDSSHEKYLAGGRITLNKKFSVVVQGNMSLSGGALYSDYTAPFTGTDRKEGLVDGSFNLSVNPNRHWELFFTTTYTRNLSTVDLFDYSRFNTLAGVKYTY